jgi:hypothetical protein
VDGTRVFVGNRFLGPIATQEPIVTNFVPGTIDTYPDTILGCSVEITLVTICTGLSSIWRDLPRPPTNLEVFEIADPTRPTRIGGVATNSRPPDIWNPNTWPHRVEATPQGIAIQSFLDNLEFFEPSARPRSLGVVGQIKRYGEVTPRGNDGRLGTTDDLDNEFVDAAFFDGFAVTMARDGARLVSTGGVGDPLQQERAPQLALISMAGTFGGRVGGVSGFEWVDASGNRQTSDLTFIATTDNRLTIFDVTNPRVPIRRGELPNTFGTMSFDPCRGVAYVHGRLGQLHVVDFNNPLDPVELNRPDDVNQALTVLTPVGRQLLGRSVSFNGNTNEDGMVYLAVDAGVAAVRIGVTSPPKFDYRQACRFKFLGPHDNALDATTSALRVSKFVTNQSFDATDPDNFKVQIVDGAVPGNTVKVDLASKKADGSDHSTLSDVTLTRVPGTNKFRSELLRLVSDSVDNDAEPTRTLIVETGGNVEMKYAGVPSATSRINVCKPSEIKTVTIHVKILRKDGIPVIDPALVEPGDIARINERYAQICMTVSAPDPVPVDPPTGVDLSNGFDVHAVLGIPTPEETALFGAEATPNTDDIQVFWVNYIVPIDPTRKPDTGLAYSPQHWTGASVRHGNNIVIVQDRQTFVLAHELGHLLCAASARCGGAHTLPLDDAHHPTDTNLMYRTLRDGNSVGHEKRLDTTQETTMRSSGLAR